MVLLQEQLFVTRRLRVGARAVVLRAQSSGRDAQHTPGPPGPAPGQHLSVGPAASIPQALQLPALPLPASPATTSALALQGLADVTPTLDTSSTSSSSSPQQQSQQQQQRNVTANVQLYNATLLLPPLDYAALAVLATDAAPPPGRRLRQCMPPEVAQQADRLAAGVAALELDVAGAGWAYFRLVRYGGWGVRATALTVRPAGGAAPPPAVAACMADGWVAGDGAAVGAEGGGGGDGGDGGVDAGVVAGSVVGGVVGAGLLVAVAVLLVRRKSHSGGGGRYGSSDKRCAAILFLHVPNAFHC